MFPMGNKSMSSESIEQRAQILKIAVPSPSSVREIVHSQKTRTSNTISLLKKMSEEQLIEIKHTQISKKGRPKKCITATPLGCEFLDAYNKLKMKPLRATKQDLARAAEDAKYASRLVENGHSPFQIFLELNTIASNIKNSSKNHPTV
jgi:DNA-binding PadR family transcriptional regulator